MSAVAAYVADAAVILGMLVLSVGVFGMIAMPDVYSRIHAASTAVMVGVVPIVLACAAVPDADMRARTVLVVVFLLLTTPVSAHALAHAAFIGREPLGVEGARDESGHLRGPPSEGREE